MTINNPMMKTLTGNMDEAGFSAEQDRLVSSVVESMAQAYFPELYEKKGSCIPPGPDADDAPVKKYEKSPFDAGFPCEIASLFEQPETGKAYDFAHAALPQPGSACPCPKEIPFLAVSPLCVAEDQPPQRVFDVQGIRKDFPILAEKVHGRSLVWFDNAATTQKPRCVIERLSYFYEHENSNVHRAAHTLAARATDAYEGARAKIASFINAVSPEEIVFVRGATEGINLVAHAYGLDSLKEGDEILVSMLEHHANIVPWQMICAKKGARIKVIPVDETGQIMLPAYEKLLSPKTKLVALTHISNALGTMPPVAQMIRMAHDFGAKVLVDGAQAAAHVKVDVQAMDCDFYVFSGHKVFGPMGIGVLYGKNELLRTMPPYQGGGSMITDVTFEKSTYKAPPHRFEAGTGSVADAVGLGAAVDYVENTGMDRIAQYERQLYAYGVQALKSINGVALIGTEKYKTSILPFTMEGFSPDEVGQALNREGIAVRTGHHCAQPILKRFGLDSVVRASLAFYNTKEEIDQMIWVLKRLNNRLPLR